MGVAVNMRLVLLAILVALALSASGCSPDPPSAPREQDALQAFEELYPDFSAKSAEPSGTAWVVSGALERTSELWGETPVRVRLSVDGTGTLDCRLGQTRWTTDEDLAVLLESPEDELGMTRPLSNELSYFMEDPGSAVVGASRVSSGTIQVLIASDEGTHPSLEFTWNGSDGLWEVKVDSLPDELATAVSALARGFMSAAWAGADPPEPEGSPAPEWGSFRARVIDVDEQAGTVTIDRIQFFLAEQASQAALEDGETRESAAEAWEFGYVRNFVQEATVLPVNANATVTRYYPDAWELQIAPGIGLLSVEEFYTAYRDDEAFRNILQNAGTRVVVEGGQVVALSGAYVP